MPMKDPIHVHKGTMGLVPRRAEGTLKSISRARACLSKTATRHAAAAAPGNIHEVVEVLAAQIFQEHER